MSITPLAAVASAVGFKPREKPGLAVDLRIQIEFGEGTRHALPEVILVFGRPRIYAETQKHLPAAPTRPQEQLSTHALERALLDVGLDVSMYAYSASVPSGRFAAGDRSPTLEQVTGRLAPPAAIPASLLATRTGVRAASGSGAKNSSSTFSIAARIDCVILTCISPRSVVACAGSTMTSILVSALPRVSSSPEASP